MKISGRRMTRGAGAVNRDHNRDHNRTKSVIGLRSEDRPLVVKDSPEASLFWFS